MKSEFFSNEIVWGKTTVWGEIAVCLFLATSLVSLVANKHNFSCSVNTENSAYVTDELFNVSFHVHGSCPDFHEEIE